MASGTQLFASAVTAAHLSPDGGRIAAGLDDGTVRIFDAAGTQLSVLVGHFGAVNDVCWAQNGQVLASGGDDKLVVVWCTRTGQMLRVLRGHTHSVTSVRFNHKGNLLASTAVDEHVRLWDVRGGSCLKVLAAHSETVCAADFSYDGTLLVSGSYDGLVRIWDIASGHCLRTLLAGAGEATPLTFIGFTPNAQYILATTLDGHTRLWNYLSIECVKDYYVGEKDLFSRSFAFAGKCLLRAAPHGVDVFDIESQERLCVLESPGGLYTVDCHGDEIMAGGATGIWRWRIAQLEPQVRVLLQSVATPAPLPTDAIPPLETQLAASETAA